MDEAVKDCWVNLPPDEFIGPGTRRIWDAARELGFPWVKQYRFVDFNKCRINCDKCLNGCTKGAKWTGRVFAEEAVKHGAKLLIRTKVRDVIVEGGVAMGVRARGNDGKRYEIGAKAVVCAAGGMGTVPILKRAGLLEAGSWFAGDATVMTSGFLKKGKGNTGEHTMIVGLHDEEHGCTFAPAIEPSGVWHILQVQGAGLRGMKGWRRFPHAMGIMCKISDEGVGTVPLEGRPSRRMTDRDRYRMDYGRITNERILIKAGCDPYSIRHHKPTLGHPGMTVRIGKLLDSNLETQIKNLYCCDTSIVPEAPGIPPALSIVIVGKYLSRRLEHIV
ncbi:MAG: GMC family oxidoreductase N-terminal domain-containing protein [Chloroflexi bacterium]|nr:GMC family oxidoreductase N-terminal domain-containing protein [Chloroflexota bacterium]